MTRRVSKKHNHSTVDGKIPFAISPRRRWRVGVTVLHQDQDQG